MAMWLFNPCSPCCSGTECRDTLFIGIFYPCVEDSCNSYAIKIDVLPEIFSIYDAVIASDKNLDGSCGSDTIPDSHLFLNFNNLMPRDEIQILDMSTISTGSFDLLGNSSTVTILATATLIDIQLAIDTIWGSGSATVDGIDGYYVITFDGSLSKTIVPAMSITNNNTDGDPTTYISQTAIEEWTSSYLDFNVSLLGANKLSVCSHTTGPFNFADIIISYPGPPNLPSWNTNIGFSSSFSTYSIFYLGLAGTEGYQYQMDSRPTFRIRVFRNCSMEVFFPTTKAECCPNIPETLSTSITLNYYGVADPPAYYEGSFNIVYSHTYKMWRGGAIFTHDYDFFGETRTLTFYVECFMECYFNDTVRVWFVIWNDGSSGFPTGFKNYQFFYPATTGINFNSSSPFVVSSTDLIQDFLFCPNESDCGEISFSITE